MPAPYGVVETGFSVKTLVEIRAELEADFRAAFGASFDVSADTPEGQFIGIQAERLAEAWEALEEVWASFDPAAATGVSLDNRAALTGTTRKASRPSTATLRATGTPGTVLEVGRVVSVVGTGVRFRTTVAATIGADGTVDVAAESETHGPFTAYAGTLTRIETPVGGWEAVTNLADAVRGAYTETDAALRARREAELWSGSGGVESIRAAVLALADVETVSVFENTSMAEDAYGIPAKAVEVLVEGGEAQAIRDAIFGAVAAGIESHGEVSGVVMDSEGQAHTVKFSRPSRVDVWVALTVVVDMRVFPLDGAAQVQRAIADFGATFAKGQNVVSSRLAAEAFKVPGVLEVPTVQTRLAAPAVLSSATIALSHRQIANFDTTRVTVTVVAGEP